MDTGEIVSDAVGGFVGSGGGHVASEFIHVPQEPKLGQRRHAVGRRKLAKFDAKVNAWENAMRKRLAIGTIAGSAATHSTQSSAARDFFWNLWLSTTAPAGNVSVTVTNCVTVNGGGKECDTTTY